MDKTLGLNRLRRWGSSCPITDEVLSWQELSDAVNYFGQQGLSNIEVLHFLEIESCVQLMSKLKISKKEFVECIHGELASRTQR